jgi:hypothetical protein
MYCCVHQTYNIFESTVERYTLELNSKEIGKPIKQCTAGALIWYKMPFLETECIRIINEATPRPAAKAGVSIALIKKYILSKIDYGCLKSTKK